MLLVCNILTSIFVLLPSSLDCDKNNKSPCLPYLESKDFLLYTTDYRLRISLICLRLHELYQVYFTLIPVVHVEAHDTTDEYGDAQE